MKFLYSKRCPQGFKVVLLMKNRPYDSDTTRMQLPPLSRLYSTLHVSGVAFFCHLSLDITDGLL